LSSGRPPLEDIDARILQVLEAEPWSSVWTFAEFLTSLLTIKEILQREPGLKRFSSRWVPHLLSPAQNVARVEASTDMPRLLHESEENHFERIATGDEIWFQYSHSYPSSKSLHDHRQMLFQGRGMSSRRRKLWYRVSHV
jgi:hypothetical protein